MSRRRRTLVAITGTLAVLVVSAAAWLAIEVDAVGVTGERRPAKDPSSAQSLLVFVALGALGALWYWAARRSQDAE
ncbi:MAG: hypothetical protein U0Q22_04245 [Acidimicrobiales bacterium]